MSFGKIYATEGNSRTTVHKVVAKENKLDIKFEDAGPLRGKPEYLKLNPLNKMPTFVGADGYVLTETIAIAVYLTSQNEKTTLLGKTKQDYASIIRWMSFANMELLLQASYWFGPLRGMSPYNKKSVDDAEVKLKECINVLEKHLLINTFLVGERLTLADIFVASLGARVFEFYIDEKRRKDYPSFTRWFETITNQPLWVDAAGKAVLCKEALKNVAPKQDAQPKKEKAAAAAAPKAAPKAAADDEEEDKPAPKPKHPLEALPKPTLVLDDWKRKYSNEETREVALPWFWENFKADEYSLWQVDFKYNDELTLVFMTSNQIGGFFARLEGSRKYIFGSCSVFGQNNDSVIKGCFVIRGQDAEAAFSVAPDWESYEFKKLDPSKKEDREFVDDQWAWDKPITVNGKPYEWADGKVFK